jgi:hypothetical protein
MSDSQPSVPDSMSLLTAYADNEGDDDGPADDSTNEQHPGANFISDDEEERHHSANRSNRHSRDVQDEKLANSSFSDKTQSKEVVPMTDSPAAKRPKLQRTETGWLAFLKLVSNHMKTYFC